MQIAYLAAAGTAAAVSATAIGPGRIVGVQVLTVGSAAIAFYDSTTTTSSTTLLIGKIPASQAAGFVSFGPSNPVLGTPFTTNIWMAGATNTPEILVYYSTGIPNDGRPAT